MTSEAELLSYGSDDESIIETEISTADQLEKSSVTQSVPSNEGPSGAPASSTNQKNSSGTEAVITAPLSNIEAVRNQNQSFRRRNQYFYRRHSMNQFRFSPFGYMPVPYGMPFISSCIICWKQGLGVQRHSRQRCPVINSHKNQKGDRICFKCKQAGHLVSQCPS